MSNLRLRKGSLVVAAHLYQSSFICGEAEEKIPGFKAEYDERFDETTGSVVPPLVLVEFDGGKVFSVKHNEFLVLDIKTGEPHGKGGYSEAELLEEGFVPVMSVNEPFIAKIAKVCHEANRAWCEANGDLSQVSWEEAQDWQRESAIKGVEFRMSNPNAPDSAQHESWMAEKLENGWVYGEVKDPVLKQHPCLVSYEQLPEVDRAKDAIFTAIVKSFMKGADRVPSLKDIQDSPLVSLGRDESGSMIFPNIMNVPQRIVQVNEGGGRSAVEVSAPVMVNDDDVAGLKGDHGELLSKSQPAGGVSEETAADGPMRVLNGIGAVVSDLERMAAGSKEQPSKSQPAADVSHETPADQEQASGATSAEEANGETNE